MGKRLRKALIATTALTDNAGSFVNETSDKLYVRKVVGHLIIDGTIATGDQARSSLDEVPTAQSETDDSRAHIAKLEKRIGAVDSGEMNPEKIVLTFDRGQLPLEPDEGLFVNNTDVVGAPTINATWNIFYED